MRVVIQRTGLSADVLRAWEKRYGVVVPGRSQGGQRLYSNEDVERLTLLRRATAGGRNISQIAALSLPALEALIAQDEEGRIGGSAAEEGDDGRAKYYRDAGLQAVERLEATPLEALLRRAAMQLGAAMTIDEVIVPLLREFGERWHRGELTPAHEHMGTAVIRRALAWMSSSATVPAQAPTAVVTTPSGQHHEIGAKIVATSAATEGWRVVFLGADLPAESIAAAATQAGAVLVALSIIFPVRDEQMVDEVVRLRHLLPGRTTLVAGGAAADFNAARLTAEGVRVVPDLHQFRLLLRALNPNPVEYR